MYDPKLGISEIEFWRKVTSAVDQAEGINRVRDRLNKLEKEAYKEKIDRESALREVVAAQGRQEEKTADLTVAVEQLTRSVDSIMPKVETFVEGHYQKKSYDWLKQKIDNLEKSDSSQIVPIQVAEKTPLYKKPMLMLPISITGGAGVLTVLVEWIRSIVQASGKG